MTSAYIRRLSQNRHSVSCIAFHHAGGSATAFRSWVPRFPDYVDLWAVQLPGREDRFSDAPADNLQQYAEIIANELRRNPPNNKLILFGHSLGALLAFEVGRQIEIEATLIVSAMEGPGYVATAQEIAVLHANASDEELISSVSDAGGDPHGILRNPKFGQIYLNTLRQDLRLLDSYTFKTGMPLKIPLTVLSGRQDPLVNDAGLVLWNHVAASSITSQTYNGGHFFCFDEAFPVADLIAGVL